MVAVAAVLVLAIPLKGWFFYRLLVLFRLRARTAFLAALNLTTFSEFGLILASIGVANGWLGEEWLTIAAIALSLSFVAASPLNGRSHELYERFSARLCRLQRPQRLAYEAEIDPGDADVIILGMGRVGAGAYDTLKLQRGRRPVGMDADPDVVERHRQAGRNAIQGSATDADFWHRLRLKNGSIRLVLLALPRLSENIFAAEHLAKEGFDGLIGAIAKFPDDETALRNAGVQMVFNLYVEAGAGLAQHVCAQVTKPA
jgi:glutathione-regulated potassium-efflux system ancillary protein KefC